MPRLAKDTVDAAESASKCYVLWDGDMAGFGLRVYPSRKRTYIIKHRNGRRSRRFTIGSHSIWTSDSACKEALSPLGRVACGSDPAEEKIINFEAMTVAERIKLYIDDMNKGLILG